MSIKQETSNNRLSNLADGNPAGFDHMVDSLVNRYLDIWWELCKKLAAKPGDITGYFAKQKKQAATDRFVDDFIHKIKTYPSDQAAISRWKNEINLLKEAFILNTGYIELEQVQFLLSSSILESTEVFINEARAYDSQIKMEDIGQAMRNVWIMNITQMLLGKPVQYTPSIFAYSMLYPYTDNYIDDAGLDMDAKRAYNDRFTRRLAGERIAPENDFEEKIFGLVELIEGDYDRDAFPGVFDSLLGIHKAQCKSLQQHCAGITPYDSDILGISFEKGGTSVLADAYLVKGSLTPAEADFFFAYGLMLQLCDDLQDAKEDFANNHHTIFSLMVGKWPIDNITDGLFNLVDYVSDLTHELDTDDTMLFGDLIRNNCYTMLYFAIAKNKELFSKPYWREIKAYIPYHRRYIKHMSKRLIKRFKKLEPSYNGMSTEKILLEAMR